MLKTTASRLKCPRVKKNGQLCSGLLDLTEKKSSGLDVLTGFLCCVSCKAKFPILNGVAILVPDVQGYLFSHAGGISRFVESEDIPKEFRNEYEEAVAGLSEEHIAEDLESERVISLYLANHYLEAENLGTKTTEWWKPKTESLPGSPVLDSLVRQFWDHGPFQKISEWMIEDHRSSPIEMVELGCGVGGLYRKLKSQIKTYLGVDSSFASIVLARHLNLGAPNKGELRIPGDLLNGALSRKVEIDVLRSPQDGGVDFVVGDLDALPLKKNDWDVSVALNAIDMLEDPSKLPAIQSEHLKGTGKVLQSCPYIWHPEVAKNLRVSIPENIRDSAEAVEWLYRSAGFEVEKSVNHLPWLFFKHTRQLEIYSVHLFSARKRSTP